MSSKVPFTGEEIRKLTELRSRVSKIYSEPNELLIAWLRARDLDVDRAEQMLRRHLIWRKNNEIEKLKSWRAPKCFFPAIHTGHDFDGGPVFIMPIGRWELRSAIETGDIVPALRYIYQSLERVVSAAHANSVYEGVIIMDFDGFGYKQIAHRTVLQGILEVLRVFEANYPEVLKHAFVINAPKIFNVLFALIKPLLHSRTLAKLQIFGSDRGKWREALLKVMGPGELPPYWGGTKAGTDQYCSEAWFYEPLPKYFMRKAGSTFDEYGDEWFSLKVAPRETLTLEFEVNGVADSTLSWAFTTEGYDIGFSVTRGDGTEEDLVPYARADSHLQKQEGSLRLEKAGKYVLSFDNGYSRARAKTLNYTVVLTQVDPMDKEKGSLIENMINNNNFYAEKEGITISRM